MTREADKTRSESVQDVPDDGLHRREDGGFAGLSSTPERHKERARQGGDTGRRHTGDVEPQADDPAGPGGGDTPAGGGPGDPPATGGGRS